MIVFLIGQLVDLWREGKRERERETDREREKGESSARKTPTVVSQGNPRADVMVE